MYSTQRFPALAALIVTVAMLLTFAACGSAGHNSAFVPAPPSTGGTPAAPPPAPAPPPTSPPPAPAPPPTGGGSAATSITGKVVDASTNKPIAGSVAVALEIESGGDYHTVMQTTADAQGNFTFANVAKGNYAIVVNALGAQGVFFEPTILAGATAVSGGKGKPISPGTNVGAVPLQLSNSAVTFGFITAPVQSSNAGGMAQPIKAVADVQVFAADFLFDLPFAMPTPAVTTATSATCPANTACGTLTAEVPVARTLIGTFGVSPLTFVSFNPPPVQYMFEAVAESPAKGKADCNPNLMFAETPPISGGQTITLQPMMFVACQ